MKVSVSDLTVCESPLIPTATLTATFTDSSCKDIQGNTIPPHLKWYKLIGSSYVALAEGGKYTGTTSSNLVIHGPALADSGTYKVVAYCEGCDPVITGIADTALFTVVSRPVATIEFLTPPIVVNPI